MVGQTYKVKHGRSAKDEETADGNHEVQAIVHGPPEPEQRQRIHRVRNPCILLHPILRKEYQLPMLVVPFRFPCFPGHDLINPPASKQRGDEVPRAWGEISQPNIQLLEVIRFACQSVLESNVDNEERGKSESSN